MSSATIPIIGLSSTYFVPGTYIQINAPAGPSAGLASPITALIMGNALSTSAAVTGGLTDGYVWGPDVVGFVVASEADVVGKFGAGCEIHRGYRRFVKGNSAIPVYILAVSEAVGGAAATQTVTLSGGSSSKSVGNGYAQVFMEDEVVEVTILNGDTLTTIASNISNAINSQINWAVTSSPSSATFTVTSKNVGVRANHIRMAVKIVGTATAAGATPIVSSLPNFTYLSGGSGLDTWHTTVASTIDPVHYRYILPATDDMTSTSQGLLFLANQITTQALPLNDNRQRMIDGYVGTAAQAVSTAKQINNTRCELICEPNSNITPFELACAAAGGYSLFEDQSIPVLNFDGMGVSTKLPGVFALTAPFDGSAMSKADQQSCLIGGVTPVARAKNGQSYIVERITTYSQNPVTGNFDPRVRDAGIMTVMDLAADLVQSSVSQSFQNNLLADDPQKGQQGPGPNVITPSIVKSLINSVLKDMADNGLLQNIGVTLDATNVIRDQTVDSRVDVSLQLYPASLAHQFGILLNQLTIS